MIQRELPKSMQDTVDQYEVELTKALTKLQLKSQVNVNYIDNSKLTATASSYQHDGSDPKNVLDDNPSTMWHTDWNLSTPHWIAFENKEEMSVNGLTYVPRQTGKMEMLQNIVLKQVMMVLIGKQLKKVIYQVIHLQKSLNLIQ